jgi:hypothetical protein
MAIENTPPPDQPTANGKHDVWAHRIVIGGLATTCVATVLGAIYLGAIDKEVPPSLMMFGCTALGALTSMLTSIMKGKEQ